jgi:flagellar biosynthesis protein FliQ
MDQSTATQIVQQALLVAVLISLPMIGLSLIVGLFIAIFQATTSIQEQTLTFVPKIIATLLAAAFFGNWMLSYTMDYTIRLWGMFPTLGP